ncbi:MAG: hypothetical protein V2B19_17465 [Pseudomonadota bacterium]
MGAIEDARKKLNRIIDKPASDVAIRITVSPGGNLEISAVSVIEDLFHDYEFFMGLANKAENEMDAKRFLRAACFSLNAWIEGTVNSLYEIRCRRDDISEKNRKKSFHDKCCELETKYLNEDKGKYLNDSVRNGLRTLRNELTHFSKGDNFLVWDNLSVPNLEHQKQHFSLWLNHLYKLMNVKPISMSDEVDFLRLMVSKLGLNTQD